MKEIINLAEGHKGFIFEFDGSEITKPMPSYHTHPELELNVVTSGTAKYFLPGREYTLGRGSLVWFFEKQPHLIREWSRNYKMYVIVFNQDLISSCTKSKRYKILGKKKPEGNFCRLVSDQTLDLLISICNTLCLGNTIPVRENPVMTWAGQAWGIQENISYQHSNKEKLNAGLAYLLMSAWDMFEEASEQEYNKLHPAVEKVLLALNDYEHNTELLEGDLENISSFAGISSGRLSRLFHSQVGIPLINYRNQKRIECFQTIFRHSPKLTISEAAYKSGFGSYSQFQKTFLKYFGYSPSEFKRKITE